MTVAPTNAIRRRLSAPHILLAALVLFGCNSDKAGHRTGGARTAAGETGPDEMDAAGDPVIEAPSGQYSAGAVSSPATISGTVSLSAPLAAAAPAPTGADSAVCGATVPDSSVQQQGTGLGNVVVWLNDVRKGKPIPLEKRIELESDHCRLLPRVQIGYTRGAVDVLAHDEFRQHLHFIAGGEDAPRAKVLLGNYEQVIPTGLPLAKPGLVIVRDVDHAWPHAFIAVFDQPYVAVTKPDGTFTIDQVPPGSYTLYSWHERTGRQEQKVEVPANGAVKLDLKLTGK